MKDIGTCAYVFAVFIVSVGATIVRDHSLHGHQSTAETGEYQGMSTEAQISSLKEELAAKETLLQKQQARITELENSLAGANNGRITGTYEFPVNQEDTDLIDCPSCSHHYFRAPDENRWVRTGDQETCRCARGTRLEYVFYVDELMLGTPIGDDPWYCQVTRPDSSGENRTESCEADIKEMPR
jgi:hypothetical protein